MDGTKRPLLPNGSECDGSPKTTTKSPQKQLPAADPPSEHIPAAVEPATKKIPAEDPPPEQISGAVKLAEDQVSPRARDNCRQRQPQRDAQGVSQEPRKRRGAANSKHSSRPNYSSSSNSNTSSNTRQAHGERSATSRGDTTSAPDRRRSPTTATATTATATTATTTSNPPTPETAAAAPDARTSSRSCPESRHPSQGARHLNNRGRHKKLSRKATKSTASSLK